VEEAVTTAPEAEGKVNTVASVPAKVKELLAVRVFPPPIVRVPVEEVMVRPFIEVAVAAPILGVVKVGELAKTIAPVPVVLLPKTVTVPEAAGKVKTVLSVPINISVLLAVKVLPEPIVRVPVVVAMVKPFIELAVAAPMLGVVKVGEVAKTIAPVPVVALPKTVTVPEALKVATTPSVPAKVRVLLAVKVLPVPMVKVLDEALMVSPL